MKKKKEMPKSNYEFFQPNPSWDSSKTKRSYRGEDCPIRSICAATGKTWEEVYDLMAISGKEVFDSQTSDASIERTLQKLGYVKRTAKVVKGQKRPTVASFVSEHADKSYVLRVAHHVVGVNNGKYYDCWDCGYCAVYSYYELAQA